MLFPIESEEKQRFMNNSKWKQRKKVFLDRFPQIENRKTEKFVPPAEKQLSYPEQAYYILLRGVSFLIALSR